MTYKTYYTFFQCIKEEKGKKSSINIHFKKVQNIKKIHIYCKNPTPDYYNKKRTHMNYFFFPHIRKKRTKK